jgi:hypothetical protein
MVKQSMRDLPAFPRLARKIMKDKALREIVTGDLPALPLTPCGRYRHYRGGEYEVLGAARHSETLEPMVVYRPLHNASGLWVRPHAMFFETVLWEGVRRPRFEHLA